MIQDKLLQIELNYRKLIKCRRKLDKMLSEDAILSDIKLVAFDNRIDDLAIDLINLKKEFENIYNEKIIFYKSRVFERI